MSICILSPQIINQISAGEIVDSPASVVKELMENSLDAGATDIKIDIYKGGIKSINLIDNGFGMSRNDLKMAIQNHSTSKIFSVNDLLKISTLGFRGEALASISSVSRLMITSSVFNQTQGWQLYSETANPRILTLNPISHPTGTSVNVLDLFYNFPVKRKHLKTEKSEFIKIDNIIKKIALSRENLNISFSHNNRLIKKYCAVKNSKDNIIRLEKLCGKNFSKNLLFINTNFKYLKLKGWISFMPSGNFIKIIRYYYVNNRIINSKIFNHAINQAVYETFGKNKNITIILYLEIPPKYVDVNIHPTKFEVLFYELRIVHSFIYQSVLSTLKQFISQSTVTHNVNNWILKNKDSAGINFFSYTDKDQLNEKKLFINGQKNNLLSNKTINKNSFSHNIISIIRKRYVLVEYQEELALISLTMAVNLLTQFKLKQGEKTGFKIQYLVTPYSINLLNNNAINIILRHKKLLYESGFEINIKNKICTFHTIPDFLHLKRKKHLIDLIVNDLLINKIISKVRLFKLILKNLKCCTYNWNYLKIFSTLSKLEKYYPTIFYCPPSSLLQKIYISPLICNLK